ncbi:MAG: DUF4149 domain-containing protein [Campylobacter sp.]|nr:DUF4149 domain-containing protein [Campylobacter sp.]
MRKFLNIYLFLLAILVGLELMAGAIVAPVIFYPNQLLGEGVLDHFQSGILMTEIFIRLNSAIIIICLISFIYELINLSKNKTESFNLKFSTFMLAAIILALACAFAFYFTDYIVEAQKLGPTATIGNASFNKMHDASEWTMKIILILQAILFFLKFPKQTITENSK